MKNLKKIMLNLAVLMLIIPLSIGLAACGDKTDDGKTDGTDTDGTEGVSTVAETDMDLTGEIPFDLDEDFSFTVTMETTAASKTLHYSTEFYALRKGDEMYTRLTHTTYSSRADMDDAKPFEVFTEERRLLGGADERQSKYDKPQVANSFFIEEWTDGHLASTTIEYLTDFLNGDHVADIPYQLLAPKYDYAMPITVKLSSNISKKNVNVLLTKIYKNGTGSITFTGGAQTVDKYKGTATVGGEEIEAMAIMTWGNIVVKADPVGDSNRMSYTVAADFHTTVTAQEWDESGAAGEAL